MFQLGIPKFMSIPLPRQFHIVVVSPNEHDEDNFKQLEKIHKD